MQGHPLGLQRGVDLLRHDLVEPCVEGGHIVVDGAVVQELVGVGEQIALALHEAAGRLLGHILPEGELAEVAVVRLVQEGFGGAQAGLLHLLGHGDGGGPFGEGQAGGVGGGIGRQGLDQRIVGSALLHLKGAVLQAACRPLPPHIPAEQPGKTDHPRLLQIGGNGGHPAALLHRDGDGPACGPAAGDLAVEQKGQPPCRQHCGQQRQQQGAPQPAAPGGGGVFARVRFLHNVSSPFQSFSRPASAACSSRSGQRAPPQSGSSRTPGGCPRRKTGAGPPPP